jgi:hypothetical protein
MKPNFHQIKTIEHGLIVVNLNHVSFYYPEGNDTTKVYIGAIGFTCETSFINFDSIIKELTK